MPLITWDLDNNLLDLSGLDTSFQDKLELPAPSEQTIRIGFYRQGSGDVRQYLDLGADPSIEFLIKPATGNGRFDVSPVVASPTFTRTAVDDLGNYYYDGNLNLAATAFLKALGINIGFARESLTIQCVANTSKRLDGLYIDIYTTASAYYRFWFETTSTTVTAPAAGAGGTLYKINVADNATADTVAYELLAGIDSVINTNTLSLSTDTVTMEFTAYGAMGAHNPNSTGFTVTLVTCGSIPNTTTDVTSVSYTSQLVYLDGTAPQLSPLFTLQINNSLYRDGQTFPAGTASSNYRTGSVTLSMTDTATVTFSSAMPTSDYKIVESVVRYTGAGSPGLKLCACSIDDRATTGFTVYFNGDATSSYTYDYTVTA